MTASSKRTVKYGNELSQWDISENDFPEGSNRSDIEKLKFFINYAILAPSSHNTQPWIFKISNDNTIELYADRTRALPVVDPEDRELTISCGAALFNLEIAISYFGYAYESGISFPDNNNEEEKDLLARITVANIKENPNKTIDKNIQKLFHAITRRRTNRLKFEEREIPDSIISELKSIAVQQQKGVWFYIASQADEKELLSNLISEGNRIQMSDK
jgi:nitroreductase